jgi:hypothetical protein
MKYIPAHILALRKLNLDAIHAVNTVNKENQYENEGYLHPILELGYDRAFASICDGEHNMLMLREWEGYRT